VTESNVVASIRRELFRLRADVGAVGLRDAIYVRDYGHGNASIEGSPRAPEDFSWFGAAEEILARMSGLPDDAGPEAVRSEFHTGV
jgi:hypothetical protein